MEHRVARHIFVVFNKLMQTLMERRVLKLGLYEVIWIESLVNWQNGRIFIPDYIRSLDVTLDFLLLFRRGCKYTYFGLMVWPKHPAVRKNSLARQLR